MANLPCVGGSPVGFVDGNGKQYSVPLTYISFPTAGGAPVLASWPGWGTGASAAQDAANFAAWVTNLVGQSILASGPVTLPPPAFTVAAAHPGSTGNDITVSFGAVTPGATPAATTIVVTVSTTQVYTPLTLSDPVTGIAAVLGTTASGGSQPGLAYVETAPTQPPTDTAATAFSGNPAQWAPASFGGGVLQATVGGADSASITASITNATAASFTLTLAWTKTQTVALTDLAGAANPFAYLVTFTPPPGGIVNPPAAQSSISLLGGTDPATITSPATAAQATVVSA